jgi:hypothetical protein
MTSTVFSSNQLENRSDPNTGLYDMNPFEHETNGALVDTMPLFASSLMALFYVLRKNFQENRLSEKSVKKSSHGEEK